MLYRKRLAWENAPFLGTDYGAQAGVELLVVDDILTTTMQVKESVLLMPTRPPGELTGKVHRTSVELSACVRRGLRVPVVMRPSAMSGFTLKTRRR